jgi:DNA invertase Pin-like site-specific DNA recombinase
MMIGYVQVSTQDENADPQRDALVQAGCERLYEDRAVGARDDRTQLAAALSRAETGDTLVVWKLAHLGRGVRSLIDLTERLREKGVEFRSLQDAIDTRTRAGQGFFHVMAALAAMEVETRRRRKAGKLRPKQIAYVRYLLTNPHIPVRDVAACVGVARSTIYRSVINA